MVVVFDKVEDSGNLLFESKKFAGIKIVFSKGLSSLWGKESGVSGLL